MIELARGARLDLEPPQAIRIAGVLGRQDLQRDVAPEPRVVREVHLAHAARAEQRLDLVRSDTGSWLEGHAQPDY